MLILNNTPPDPDPTLGPTLRLLTRLLLSLYKENVMVRAPPSGSEPVAISIAVEELWLKDFDFAAVLPQPTVVSGAYMVVVDGVFGVELDVATRTGAACTTAAGNSSIGTATRVLQTSKDKAGRRPEAEERKWA
jgi:hypothetical protein